MDHLMTQVVIPMATMVSSGFWSFSALSYIFLRRLCINQSRIFMNYLFLQNSECDGPLLSRKIVEEKKDIPLLICSNIYFI